MELPTILVVEDDPNDENLTLRALRGLEGACSVVVARTGKCALDFLLRRDVYSERASEDPVVVYLDNTLPGIAGNELVSIIRAEASLAGLPIVVFSGTSDERLIARCLDAGADAFLEKPIDMGDYVGNLRASAREWLARAG